MSQPNDSVLNLDQLETQARDRIGGDDGAAEIILELIAMVRAAQQEPVESAKDSSN